MSNGSKRGAHSRIAAVISAVALAALTLGTFAILREVGPESTVRKFHRAAVNRDYAAAFALSTNSTPNEVAELSERVAFYAGLGAHFQIQAARGKGNQYFAQVAYIFPNGRLVAAIWVVERRDASSPWKINVSSTNALNFHQ